MAAFHLDNFRGLLKISLYDSSEQLFWIVISYSKIFKKLRKFIKTGCSIHDAVVHDNSENDLLQENYFI